MSGTGMGSRKKWICAMCEEEIWSKLKPKGWKRISVFDGENTYWDYACKGCV